MFFSKKYDKDGYNWNKYEIDKRPLVHTYLSYKDFYDNYVRYNIEEAFRYNDKIIDLNNDGNKFSYSYFNESLSFMEQNTYDSAEEFFEKAMFDGKKLQDIWNELK